MSFIDGIILFIIVLFALAGFKMGFLYSTVSFVGTIIVVAFSFVFKNYISIILYENFPFIKFAGYFKNISVMNIMFYEVIAFIVTMIILAVILKVLLSVSKFIEKILKATIILSIPSKLAGALVGVLSGYVVVFVLLYVCSLSIFNIPQIQNSKYREPILTKTPVLTNLASDAGAMIKDFETLKVEYDSSENENDFNLKCLDMFLKYKVISVESVDKLIEQGKLKVDNIESVLVNYRKVV